MGRRTYTDTDRAAVYALLATNNGNVDRTVRESGVPRATVLSWKKKWEKEGAPSEVTDEAAKVAGDFIAEATATRFEAIRALRNKIESGSVRDLATVVGILDDKIARAELVRTGRPAEQHLHVHALPAPEELGPMLGDYLSRALGAARRRDAVTIEAVEESSFRELPAAATKE